MRAFFVVAAFLLGCSGSSASPSSTTDASSDAPSGVCRDDVDHRASAATCTSHADAGPIPNGCGGTITPHDGCLTDGDCAGGHGTSGACMCQDPHANGCGATQIAGNACISGNCLVDADCSECGKCRIEQSCGQITGLYCETKADTCSKNADCGTGFCSYRNGHFECVTDVACAG